MAHDNVPDESGIERSGDESLEGRIAALEEHNRELEARLERRYDGVASMTRRGALGVLGGGALLGAAGSASANSHSGDGTAGSGKEGNQPWYEWEADVDAGGHDLTNLAGVDVEHFYTAARDADVVVWRGNDDVYHADGPDGNVASGSELMAIVQAAVDSLSEGRTTMERVLVASSGVVTADDDVTGVDLPSYTSVDVASEITVEGETDDLFSASSAEYVEIPRLTVKGSASRAILMDDCSAVRLGRLWIEGVTVQGVRLQGGCEDVQMDRVYVAHNGHHGVETYDVTRIQIGQVLGVDPGSSVVLPPIVSKPNTAAWRSTWPGRTRSRPMAESSHSNATRTVSRYRRTTVAFKSRTPRPKTARTSSKEDGREERTRSGCSKSCRPIASYFRKLRATIRISCPSTLK